MVATGASHGQCIDGGGILQQNAAKVLLTRKCVKKKVLTRTGTPFCADPAVPVPEEETPFFGGHARRNVVVLKHAEVHAAKPQRCPPISCYFRTPFEIFEFFFLLRSPPIALALRLTELAPFLRASDRRLRRRQSLDDGKEKSEKSEEKSEQYIKGPNMIIMYKWGWAQALRQRLQAMRHVGGASRQHRGPPLLRSAYLPLRAIVI